MPHSPSTVPTRDLPLAILLNGPSSAGKSTLVGALQNRFRTMFLGFGIDSILYALPPADLAAMKAGRPINREGYTYDLLVEAHHAAIRAVLESGCRVIVDTALLRPAHRIGFDTAVKGFDTFRIGVTCNPDELDRRERERGDRPIGSGRREAGIVHDEMLYDLVVDTTDTLVDVLLDQVLDALHRWRP